MFLVNNMEKFVEKILSIRRDGLENFGVVADFDKTLSQPNMVQPKASSTVGILRAYNYLGDDYVKKAYALFDRYHPYEIDETLSFEEKSKKMDEWWQTHIKVMVEHGLNREIVEDIVKSNKIKLRDGIDTFINFLKKRRIPLLIFSAGLGDVIEGVLKKQNLIYDELRIISNFFEYDDKGNVLGYKNRKIVHSLNKGEIVFEHNHYIHLSTKKNILLLGDSLGDLSMVMPEKHHTILSLGFYCFEDDSKLGDYLKSYDGVMKDFKTMYAVNSILKLLE